MTILLRPLIPLIVVFTLVMFVLITLAQAVSNAPQLAYSAVNTRDYGIFMVDTFHRLNVPLIRQESRMSAPIWSSDGQRFAYVVYTGRDHLINVYDMNTQQNILTFLYGRTLNALPTWSPDGTKLAFVSNQGSQEFGLFQIDVNEAQITPLQLQPVHDATPIWSADGARIFYSAWRNNRIVAASIEVGQRQERIILDDYYRMYSPAWSPDRTRIAFSSTSNSIVSESSIFTLDIVTDQTLPDETIHYEQSRPVTTSVDGNYQPVWSPDGETIAFVSDRDGQDDLYMVSTDSDMPTRLTNLGRTIVHATWSPDGETIAFIMRSNNGRTVMVVDAQTGNPYPVTQNRVPIGVSWRP